MDVSLLAACCRNPWQGLSQHIVSLLTWDATSRTVVSQNQAPEAPGVMGAWPSKTTALATSVDVSWANPLQRSCFFIALVTTAVAVIQHQPARMYILGWAFSSIPVNIKTLALTSSRGAASLTQIHKIHRNLPIKKYVSWFRSWMEKANNIQTVHHSV